MDRHRSLGMRHPYIDDRVARARHATSQANSVTARPLSPVAHLEAVYAADQRSDSELPTSRWQRSDGPEYTDGIQATTEEAPEIYVVDDDGGMRQALCSLFRSVGLAALPFASARKFLDASWRDTPACLVLDVWLPGLSGLDLQRELAERAILIPVIFITGSADVLMTVRAMKAGAVEFRPDGFGAQPGRPTGPADLAELNGAMTASPCASGRSCNT
jgi:CheY-like chemotaxis protein